MKRIAPIQWLTLIFLVGLTLLVLFFRGQIPLWRSLLLRYGLWIGLLFALRVSSERRVMGRVSSVLHDFSPVLFVILIYQSLGDLIQHLRPDIDVALIKIDHALFGVHPTLWLERFIVPWFTDVMSVAYGSYYFLPVILILTLYLSGRKKEFETAIFVLLFGYYVSYIGYILFPAIGPRYTLSHLQTVPLEGSFITDFVRDILNSWEHNKRDCMPSGHTQIALTVLVLSFRFQRRLFYAYVPIVSGLILSTLYLRYHYVIDVFVGSALAITCVPVASVLWEGWKKNTGLRHEC